MIVVAGTIIVVVTLGILLWAFFAMAARLGGGL